jgi:hypothetical protein
LIQQTNLHCLVGRKAAQEFVFDYIHCCFRQGIAANFELYMDKYSDIFSLSPSNGSRAVQAKLLVVNGSRLDYDFGQRVYTFNVSMTVYLIIYGG